MTARRHHGDGSVYRDARSGRWIASLSNGTDATGRRRRPRKAFKSKAEAEGHLRKLRAQRDQSGLPKGPSQTLDEFTTWWFATEGRGAVRPSTLSTYQALYRLYLKPGLGRRRLVDIEPIDVITLQSELEERGRSRNTVKRARSVLHLLFNHAVRLEVATRNPVSRVKPLRMTEESRVHRHDPLSIVEAKELLAVAEGTDLEGIVTLALVLGLRRGEVLALHWKSVNLETGTLQVTGTLKEYRAELPDGSGKVTLRVDPPKTRNSARTIQLPAPVIGLLRRHRSTQNQARLHAGTTWVDNDAVFTNPTGGYLWPNAVLDRFKRMRRDHDMRPIRFHDLRHSAATMMLELGVPLEAASQTLGHATIGITKDIYASYVPALINRATATMGEALLGAPTEVRALPKIAHGDGASRSSRAPDWQADR